jgi:hypothetical protein
VTLRTGGEVVRSFVEISVYVYYHLFPVPGMVDYLGPVLSLVILTVLGALFGLGVGLMTWAVRTFLNVETARNLWRFLARIATTPELARAALVWAGSTAALLGLAAWIISGADGIKLGPTLRALPYLGLPCALLGLAIARPRIAVNLVQRLVFLISRKSPNRRADQAY